MAMKGFDKRWKDFPGYILGVTEEIREGRGVASLRDHYSKIIPVRSPDSVIIGNEAVISATLATQAEFPDRRLLGEDVISCGSPETGMLSSHRLFSTATHAGDGAYGSATGRRVGYRVIADCHAINGHINDEWLIRDQGAIVRQLGRNPAAFAKEAMRSEKAREDFKPFNARNDPSGPYKGRGNETKTGDRYAEILDRIMVSDFPAIAEHYDPACQLDLPGGVSAHGHDQAARFWTALRASFPDAKFTIEHLMGVDRDRDMPPRAAIRWGLHGKHRGRGAFGEPTGADVYVMGACHAEFGPRGVRREFVLYDEVAIWKQIVLHTIAEEERKSKKEKKRK